MEAEMEEIKPLLACIQFLKSGRGGALSVTRANSTNVLDEGLRIGEIGRRMNSKVKLVE
jgi:hypothetical protein